MADDSAAPATAPCPCCGIAATKVCSGCRDIVYCSPACQKADWPFHKHLCKTFKDFQERPAPDMRRVVVFPEDGDRPIFKWLEVEDFPWGHKVCIEGTDLEKATWPRDCTFNPRTMQLLPERIVIYYDDSFSWGSGCFNTSLMAATDGRLGYQWDGPMIAVSGASYEENSVYNMRDFSMSQYSSLIAFFVAFTFTTQRKFVQYDEQEFTSHVEVLKLLNVPCDCDGEQVTMYHFETSADHPIFHDRVGSLVPRHHQNVGPAGTYSPISQRIGMSLLAWKVDSLDTTHSLTTPSIATIFTLIEADVDTFGTILPGWDHVRADVLLGRCEAEPLDLSHEEVTRFLAYCEHYVAPLVAWALEVDKASRMPRIEEVLEKVTAKTWESFHLP
ncbi:uncharacterized protein RCC_01688 [Ramularia collo-cygni]|uniref:MYND-type domain-containing protein n=1 Tax=Ramularia collo-cygni TaxID=112498 RepID=A0A2D3UM08_9PEZI|nr:uncharacterized protein RCC_01688 [Ramularia collo-cygni]CZT15852.1 uncharacterized protein RCC_01688 [Ramularia collo-cygni]